MFRKDRTPHYVACYSGAVLFFLIYLFSSNRYGGNELNIVIAALCGLLGAVDHSLYLWQNRK